MKSMFPQYEERTPQDFDQAWKNGLFVFDTNVLLNLYRYHATTRDELIKVVGQLAQRIWIPHHVALEFQRNRLKVIAEQSRRFIEVKRTVEKARSSLFGELEKLQLHKRHALINPEPLTSGFSKLAEEFLAELEALRKKQQSLTEPDPLKDTIEDLFEGRVGTAPETQASLDELYKEAEWRYKLRIPPGYGDAGKAHSDEPNEHLHCGLVYKRHYGDFLVWRQILDSAQANNVKHLILITDDSKEDWWRKVDAEGPKIIGPRPELIDEARLIGGVEHFLMYSPEGFLKYAKEFLQAKVSEETLKEVRYVSRITTNRNMDFRKMRDYAERAELSVYRWLSNKFPSVEHNRFGFPDFVVSDGDRKLGFEIKSVANPRALLHKMKELLFRAYYKVEEAGYSEVSLVLIAADPEDIEELRHLSMKMFRERMPENIRIVIGSFDDDAASGEGEFIPYDDFSWQEANMALQRTR